MLFVLFVHSLAHNTIEVMAHAPEGAPTLLRDSVENAPCVHVSCADCTAAKATSRTAFEVEERFPQVCVLRVEFGMLQCCVSWWWLPVFLAPLR